MSDIVWDVDGWTGYQGMVTLDDLGVDWFVQSTQGWWRGTGIRNNDQDKTGADGAFYSPPDRAARVVTITGYATCPDESVMEQAMDRFNGLLADRTQLHTLTVFEQSRTRQADVHLGDAPFVEPIGDNRFDFELTVIAPDPLKYGEGQSPAITGLQADAPGGVYWNGLTGNGVPWNGVAGALGGVQWQAGAGSNGVITLANPGTAAAPIQFIITGPVPAPSLVRLDTDETITYPDTMTAGQTLVIDTSTGRVTLDGANRRPQLTRADFFTIPAHGEISVAFRAAGFNPDASVAALWRSAWL